MNKIAVAALMAVFLFAPKERVALFLEHGRAWMFSQMELRNEAMDFILALMQTEASPA